VTYQEQPYYQEFRELLKKLIDSVSELKGEKKRLEEENRTLSDELKSVRSELSGARKEIDALNAEVLHGPEEHTGREATSDAGKKTDTQSGPKSFIPAENNTSPSLFDNLTENEKMVLRQQINDLISRIDRHISKTGDA